MKAQRRTANLQFLSKDEANNLNNDIANLSVILNYCETLRLMEQTKS